MPVNQAFDDTYRRYSPNTTSYKDYVTSINIESEPSTSTTNSNNSSREPTRSNKNHCESNLQLIWSNIIYRRNSKKNILEKQSGFISGGTLTAIIGPSGAGKSTLLECLAGRRKTGLRGDIYVSFESLPNRQNPNLKISLIGQHDEAIAVLTVREVLTFASRLKNYSTITNRYYTPRLVESVLDELSLQKCADTKVRNISGGQLKRLVFGVELISGPDIILLDEPTSGLDASSAYSCVKLVKKLTDLRKNIYSKDSFKAPAIICSIHQPSARVLNKFDKIYVLSYDGRCIFQGSPSILLEFLSIFELECPSYHNPADFIIEIASGDYGLEPINRLALEETERQLQEMKDNNFIAIGKHGNMAINLKRDKVVYMKIHKVIDKMKNQNFPTFLHTYLLWKRTLITNLREPKLTWFRLFQAIFVALLMSFLYDYPIGEPDGCYPRADQVFTEIKSTEDNIAFVFFITLFTVMASMMPTVLTFPSEVSILLQERNNGWYSCATYYVAKITAELPLQIIITFTFIAIIYPLTGQVNEWPRFGYFCLICLLISSIAQCVGILFGTYYVKSVENAVFLAPLSMAPVFLLSGFFGKLSAIPLVLKPIAYVSYVRYAFEGLLITLYGMNRCHSDSSSGTSNSSVIASGSDSVPSHLLNTGYVSRNEIDYANRRIRKNASRFSPGSSFSRFNPNSNFFWDSSTTTTQFSTINEDIHDPYTTSPPHLQDDHPGDSGDTNLLFLGNSSGSSFDLFSGGSYVLKRFDVASDAEALYVNLIILGSFLLFLRILCYVILLNKTNQRK
jgi:ABC-type multidrug transport system ATPase subunit/ABC-type multidrug transport system permease subunit